MTSSINASTSGGGGVITSADSSGILALQTGGTTAMTIDASQNVGIGTSSPSQKLDLGSGFVKVGQGVGGGGGVWFPYSSDASGRTWRVRTDIVGYGDFGFEQSTTQTGTTFATKMLLDSSGNVGIGTSSPAAKLDVAGTFRTSDVTNLYGTAASLRGINFGSNEIAWAQGTTSCFLNLCSTTGNSGSSYNLVIRGLDTNGAAAATLSYITLDATSLYFTGSGGSNAMFPCRSWVNFSASTGAPVIRADGNVDTIADNGVGAYTVTFTTAMPDANYSISGGATDGTDGAGNIIITFFPIIAAGSFKVRTSTEGGAASDAATIMCSVHR